MKAKRKVSKAPSRSVALAVVLAIGCIFGISAISFAGASFYQMAAEAYGNAMADKTDAPQLDVEDTNTNVSVENDFLGARDGFCQAGAATTTVCKTNFGDSVNFAEMVWFNGSISAATSSWAVSEDGFVVRFTTPGATTTGATSFGLAGVGEYMTSNFVMNTWGKSKCRKVTVDILTGSDDLGLYFQVGTSTPSSTDSIIATSTPNLIALTQIPTSTNSDERSIPDDDAFYSSWSDPGTFWQAYSDSLYHLSSTTTLDWYWELGQAVTFDVTTTDPLASSTPFAETTGYVDIECTLTTVETAQ